MSKEKNKELDDKNEELISIDWEETEVPEFLNKIGDEVADPDDGETVTRKDDENDLEVLDDLDEKDTKKSGKGKVGDNNKSTKSRDEDEEDKEDQNDSDEDKNDSKKKEAKTPPSEGNEKSSPALIFAKFLNEKGVVSLEEDDIKKLGEIVKEDGEEAAFEFIFNKEVESRVEQIKSVYEDDVQEYIALRDFGVNPEVAAKLVKNKNVFDQIDDSDIESEENASLRKEVIKQYLKSSTKMSDEDIEDQVETLIDTGKDVQWAKKSLNYLKQQSKELIEQEKKRIKQQEEEEKKRMEETKELVKKTIMDTKEILGNEVTANMKNKIIKLLLEPAGKDPNGNPIDGVVAWLLQDPLKNRINLAYAIASGILDGKLNSIKKKVKSEVIEELEQSIYERNNMLGGSTKAGKSSDALEALKQMFPMNNEDTF